MGLKSLKRTFKNIPLAVRKKLRLGTTQQFVSNYYEYYTGKKIDINNPIEFNQKIQWLKVFYRPDILHQLVDKYAVREFVSNTIGDEYLNDLLGVYYRSEDVDFDLLPDQFVIKGTHGCGYNLIVKDKKELDIKDARKKFKKWLSRDYYTSSGEEWAYKDVPQRLVAEAYMKQDNKSVLDDYKIYCFNGVPKFIQVVIERGNNNSRCFYNVNWEKLPFWKSNNSLHEGDIPQPKCLEEMISVARKLSEKFPFVRVDLYDVNNKVIFGEMTFYPSDGRSDFTPEKYNTIIGDMLNLPSIPSGQDKITSF